MSRYGRRKISRRDLLKAASAVILSGAALGGGAYLLQLLDDEQSQTNTAGSYTTNDHRTQAELRELTYKGKTYRQKADVESYLFLGIDVMGPAVGTQSYIAGGQADAQMLLVLDNEARTWQLLETTAPAAAAEFEATVGETASQYTPIALYDIAASPSAEAAISEAGSVQVAISVPGVADGTQLVAVCWDRNGNSRVVPVRVVNGVVYLTVASSGPVMIMARTQAQE